MATTFYPTGPLSDIDPTGADDKELSLARGSGLTAVTTNTAAGPTAGVQATVTAGGTLIEWYSKPLDAVTIAGTVTLNVWMAETNMSANVGAQVIIERCSNAGAVLSTILNSEKGTELPVTTRAAQNWTGTPTSTALSAGDRLRVRILGNDGGGTMASGHAFTLGYGAASGGVDGDSFVTFTETITESTGSITVTPGVASLSVSTFAPTVTASDHKTITPPAASLSITALAPSVTVGVRAIPGVVALATSAFAPTVAVSDNKLVTPGVTALATSVFAPTVTVTDHKTVTPALATLALTAFAPTVTGGSGSTVVPGLATLSLSAFAPVVTASDHKVVTPELIALSTSAFAPTVTATNHQLATPGVLALTLSAFAPTVTATAHQTVTPGTVALVATAFAPTVTATNHQIVVPGIGTLILATFAPTIGTVATVSGSATASMIETFTATATVGDTGYSASASVTELSTATLTVT